MRRGNNPSIRRIEDGRIESVNLGADFCAEHEWGIDGLQQDFGLDGKAAPGLPRRKVNAVPDGLRIVHERGSSVVVYNPYSWIGNATVSDELEPYSRTEWGEVIGGWSDKDFGVRLAQKRDAVDLYEAFQRMDMAFLFGNTFGNPFANGGLVLAIASRLPAKIIESLAEMAEDADRLRVAAEATGIAERLRRAGTTAPRPLRYLSAAFGYYALSPRWKDDSRTEVVFWLNPTNQQDNNAGWYTVADLDDWIAGTGKVPKAGNG